MRSPGVVAVIAATLLSVAACSSGSDEPRTDPPPVEPTPLADFATDEVVVARDSFCARVAPAAVEDVLGGAADSADEWANGERASVAPDVTDVVHEYGCRWRAADGTTVSGWVFAPPVTPERAAGLRRAATQADGCRAVADAPAYGSRSVAVRCGDTTSFHGLFGDAWLSCSAGGGAEIEAVGRWCVNVAQAASVS